MNKGMLFIGLLLVAGNIKFVNAITNFDDEMLKSLEIDPIVAKQLSENSRFLPGKQFIHIYVNNKYKKRIEVLINNEGSPCFNKEQLFSIGLNVLNKIDNKESNQCFLLTSLWDNVDVLAKTTRQELWIFAPESVVVPSSLKSAQEYQYGGNSALLNYRANYMGSSGNISTDMYFINTELGINTHNWQFRSAQSYNHISDSTYLHQYLYAQTTWEAAKKNVQIGQFNLNNGVVGSAKVIGVQLFPENSLEDKVHTGTIVSGVATESSMVEIYQSGQLIYQTAVPQGPFELSQFSLLNRTADLHVKLNGVNGYQHSFTVPASSFLPSTGGRVSGYSIGLGRYDEKNARKNPLIASLSKGWQLSHRINGQWGGVFTADYYSLGLNSDVMITPNMSFNMKNTFTYDATENISGNLASVYLGYRLSDTISVGGSALSQSSHYRYLSDSINSINDKNFNNEMRQWSSNINWSLDSFGGLNASFGKNYTADQTNDYISASWSKTWAGRYLLSTTFQRNFTDNNKTEDALYVRLSIPFERANVSMSLNHTDNSQRMNVRYQNYQDIERNWGIGYEHQRGDYQSISANINQVTPYTQIGLNARRSNEHQSDWGVSLNGGATLSSEGFLFSPYPIKETFGIAKVGNTQGVKLNSSAGTTWTNSNGYAVLPSLEAYRENAITVDTRTLGRRVDILNAYQSVTPAKGSVVPVTFATQETRRLMITSELNHMPLPVNSIIKDEAGNFLTLITHPGRIFISDATLHNKLIIETPEKNKCTIAVNLPQQPDLQALYEKANITCVPF